MRHRDQIILRPVHHHNTLPAHLLADFLQLHGRFAVVANGEGLAEKAGTCEAGGIEPFGEFLGGESVASGGEVGRGGRGGGG